MENFGRVGTSAEDRVEFLDRIDHPQVGMILDIATSEDVNPMTIAGSPTAILEKCGHRLKHLHLHGFKDGRDHHPPVVENDEIQWRELFEMIGKMDYPGVLNFEPRGLLENHPDTLDYVQQAPARLAALAA